MVEKLYQEELRWLREAGAEFATAYPLQAAALGLDGTGERDPAVERLLEGVAFLTARIRERIDSYLPDTARATAGALWPHLLQDLPCATVLQFTPRRGMLQQTRVIATGAQALSAPVGSEPTVCRFSTTRDVILNPIRVDSVTCAQCAPGRDTISVDFTIDRSANPRALRLDPLALYCAGERDDASALHELLAGHVLDTRVTYQSDGREIAGSCVTHPAGMAPGELLLATADQPCHAYSLLVQYFAAPETLLFVNICGIDRAIAAAAPVGRFSITFDLDCRLPPSLPLSPASLLLHCVPAVNLFERDTEPVLDDATREEYRVVADASRQRTVLAHGVVSVTALDRSTGVRETLRAAATPGLDARLQYEVRQRTGAADTRELWISPSGGWLDQGHVRQRTLSIRANCTNGALPHELLRAGSITQPGPGAPESATVTNLTRPSLPARAPGSAALQWNVVSLLRATAGSLCDVDALRGTLDACNWGAAPDGARVVKAITHVALEQTPVLERGMLIQGWRFAVTLDRAVAGQSAALRLFGSVVQSLLGHLAPVNTRIGLRLNLLPGPHILDLPPAEAGAWPV